jgi:hypothetical protein
MTLSLFCQQNLKHSILCRTLRNVRVECLDDFFFLNKVTDPTIAAETMTDSATICLLRPWLSPHGTEGSVDGSTLSFSHKFPNIADDAQFVHLGSGVIVALYTPRFNIAPEQISPTIPVIVRHDGGNECRLMHWGLIPY